MLSKTRVILWIFISPAQEPRFALGPRFDILLGNVFSS